MDLLPTYGKDRTTSGMSSDRPCSVGSGGLGMGRSRVLGILVLLVLAVVVFGSLLREVAGRVEAVGFFFGWGAMAIKSSMIYSGMGIKR